MPLWAPGFVRKALLNELQTELIECQASKIYCHAFSNNGTWVLAELMQSCKIPISKIVLDSAPWFVYEKLPIRVEAKLLTKVVTSVALNGVIDHPIISPAIYNLLLIGCGACRVLELVQNQTSRPLIADLVGLSRFLRDSLPINVPLLMLYSKDDLLIPPEIILEFVAHLKKRGLSPVCHEFETGGHVGAFWHHKVVYKQLLRQHYAETSA